jgi:WD40 repeat protein
MTDLKNSLGLPGCLPRACQRCCRLLPCSLWHFVLIAVVLFCLGGTLPALEQGPADSTSVQTDENAARPQRQYPGNDVRSQQHLVDSAFLRGKIARHNGNPAEALCWYLQAYLNSPPEDELRRSARNLIGAWGTDLKHTLVHDRDVKCVAVDPEGRFLMAGYLTTNSQLWNLATGKPIGEPQRHYGSMMSTELSPDGTFALTCDWEGAKVWDVGTGELRYPRLDHMIQENTIVPPRISPDGRTIVTRPSLEKIRLWDAETGEPRGPAQSHGGGVARMVFSPDSQTMASLGGADVRLWNTGSVEPIGEPLEGVNNVAFDPESRLMATAGSDGKLRILEIESGRTIAERRHDHPLRSVQFDPTGRHLLTYKTRYFVDRELSEAEEAWLWLDAAGANPVLREVPHGRGLFSASLSPTAATC